MRGWATAAYTNREHSLAYLAVPKVGSKLLRPVLACLWYGQCSDAEAAPPRTRAFDGPLVGFVREPLERLYHGFAERKSFFARNRSAFTYNPATFERDLRARRLWACLEEPGTPAPTKRCTSPPPVCCRTRERTRRARRGCVPEQPPHWALDAADGPEPSATI